MPILRSANYLTNIKTTTMILFIYFLIYFFLVFVLRSYFLWSKTGVNPLTFNKGDDAHGYNENKTELITKGFFARSRNPIFLGIIIANIGIFLVLPNAFTLLIISLSTTSINTQVRLEEAFLLEEHGDEYLAYKNKVSRWITIK